VMRAWTSPACTRGETRTGAMRRSRACSGRRSRSAARPEVQGGALQRALLPRDGGQLWEAGEVEGPEESAPDIRPVRVCWSARTYPFSTASRSTLRYSRSADVPEMELAASGPPGRGAWTTRRSWTIEGVRLRAPRQIGGTVPHDVRGRSDGSVPRPNVRFQDVNDGRPRREVRHAVWRGAVAPARTADDLSARMDDRETLTRGCRSATETATG